MNSKVLDTLACDWSIARERLECPWAHTTTWEKGLEVYIYFQFQFENVLG